MRGFVLPDVARLVLGVTEKAKETPAERSRRWRKENPEKHREYQRGYMRMDRARKRREVKGE